MPYSKQDILTQNINTYPNNNSGQITPDAVKTFNQNWIDSVQFTDTPTPQAVSASYALTATSASFAANAANAANAASASYAALAISASTANTATSASYAVTASFALNVPATASFAISASQATSASFATTASFALNVPATASFAISASQANSASYAATASFLIGTVESASYASNADKLDGKDSSVFATTGSNTFTDNQTISAGKRLFTDVVANNSIAGLTLIGSGAPIVLEGNTVVNPGFTLTADQITGSLFGTASFAVTASHALNVPATASFAISASFATSASYAANASNAVSASYAATASGADVFTVRTALTASGLNYPTADNGEKSFMQTDGAGNLSLQYVDAINDVVYNGELTTITKGTPLYVNGAQGANPIVFRADASDPSKMPVIYIAAEDITSNVTGRAVILGEIDGVNTTGYAPGTEIYVAAGGGWTSTRPTGSAIVQILGIVTKEGNGGQGVVLNPGPANLPNIASGNVWIGNANGIPTATSTGSINAATAVSASFANTIASGLNISASSLNVANNATIGGNLTVNGTASFNYVQTVTGSAIIIGQEYIILNTQLPAARYAGLQVYDSGSTNTTASIVWDSQRNHWVYEYGSGSYTGGGFLAGPRNTGSLADITYPTQYKVVRGQGGDHLYDSNITDNDTNIILGINTQITGTLGVTGTITGNLTGTASYASNAGAAQTAVTATSATSASYALTASYASNVSDTASFAISASFASTAATATSASFATTASFALNVPATASFATTASYANNAGAAQTAISASFASTAAAAQTATSASFASTAAVAQTATSASFATTASFASSVVSASFANTASYALNAQTFPYSGNAVISGSLNISSSVTANNVITNQTDTYVSTPKIHEIVSLTQAEYNAVSESLDALNTLYIISGSTSADFATSASYAATATSASFASTAATAATATSATSASFATTASYALNAAGGGFPFTGNAVISGSLNVSSSIGSTNLISNQYDTFTGTPKVFSVITCTQAEYESVSGSAEAAQTLFLVLPTTTTTTTSTTTTTTTVALPGSQFINVSGINYSSGNLTDTSGNGYNGTVTNGSSATATGGLTALKLTNGKVAWADSVPFDTGGFMGVGTISLWFQFYSQNSVNCLFSKWDDSGNNRGLLANYRTSTPYMESAICSTGTCSAAVNLDFNTTLNNNQWYMLTMWSDGTNAKMYVNSTETKSAAWSSTCFNNTSPFNIGFQQDFGGDTRYAPIFVGEFIMWKSAVNVADVFNATKTKYGY